MNLKTSDVATFTYNLAQFSFSFGYDFAALLSFPSFLSVFLVSLFLFRNFSEPSLRHLEGHICPLKLIYALHIGKQTRFHYPGVFPFCAYFLRFVGCIVSDTSSSQRYKY